MQLITSYLPQDLTETDKLAALRTMIGMTQPERADYIQRIKWAMEDEGESKDKDEDEDKKEEPSKKLPKGLRDAIAKKQDKEEEEEEDSEKEAAYILRRLGLGL